MGHRGTRQALVVLDAQRAFWEGVWLADAFVSGIQSLIRSARQRGFPVVYVQHETAAYPQGTPGWELIPELMPLADEPRVHKRQPSAFRGSALDDELRLLDVGRIVLCGLWSGSGIQATMADAVHHGYDVALVDDGHTTHDAQFDGVPIPAEVIVAWQNLQADRLSTPDGLAECVGRGQAFDWSVSL